MSAKPRESSVPKVAFRTDASAMIGTGHVMRCLALADALRVKGAECRFLCRDHSGHLKDLIEHRGYSVDLLLSGPGGGTPSAVSRPIRADWLGVDWQTDAHQTISRLTTPPDWLIVDHYAIDRNWEAVLRQHCERLMVIDDLADRPHDCDILLDQNFLADPTRYAHLVPSRARTLLGPQYALLRGEFAQVGDDRDEVIRAERGNGGTPRLLVMFGGADPGRQTERVVRLLQAIMWEGPVDVVAGSLYPDVAALREAMATLPEATLHVAADDVACLMRKADLAVGAPGVASLERCACALPSLTVSQAWNQEEIAEALAETGAHWYLGRQGDVRDEDWLDALKVLAKYPALRRTMSRAAALICDGRGALRVAAYLLQKAMSVRAVTATDGDLLFSWRNDERTRRLSRDPRPLEYRSHLRWLERTRDNPDIDLLLCGITGHDMACVRFDCAQDTATVSIYVDPDLQGQGVGRAALQAGIDWLKQRRPDLRQVCADVTAANFASHKLFAASGFARVESRYVLDLQA